MPNLGLTIEAQARESIVASDVQARNFSTKKRKKLAKSGDALPDGSFPIKNKQDLSNAKRTIGLTKHPTAAKKFINKKAKQLGAKPLSAGGPGSGRHKGEDEWTPGGHGNAAEYHDRKYHSLLKSNPEAAKAHLRAGQLHEEAQEAVQDAMDTEGNDSTDHEKKSAAANEASAVANKLG